MAAEADTNEEGYEQWKYSIYLVSFPGVAEYPETKNQVVPVADIINHLVPEARVFTHQIFPGDRALYPPEEPVEEQEGRGSEGQYVRSTAGKKTQKPAPDEVNKRENPDGLDVDASEAYSMKPVAVEAIEASVLEDVDTDEDSVSVSSVATHTFSPAWIEEEALALLETIQKKARTEKSAYRSKVLLAGFGFGGIVVKQAVIIANTTPKYYDVALNISSLVFFATPHRSNNRLGWEDVLLDMIKATKTIYRDPLSHVLSRLADSVSQLSYVFYRFTAKYPTKNFIECKGLCNNGPVVGELGKFNDLEEVVSWPDKDFNSFTFCALHDLDKLESLRTHFAPVHLLNQGVSDHLNGTSQLANDDSYLEALQSLSPSRWIIYETRTLDKSSDSSELKDIYRSLLSGIAGEDVRAKGSIQVTGPAGYGKSAVVKLISQELRQRLSVVAIDNFLSSSERTPPTLYGVYISFLHQIISQRPSLFLLVQNLMVETLRRETWTEESPLILLAAIFHRSLALDFLIVIYDFEHWPSEIRSWWSETLGSLVRSGGSTLTFLTSSHRPINSLTSAPPHELDLEKEYGRHKEDFIRAKTNNLLGHDYSSVISGKGLSDNIKKKIMSAAWNFQGSFTATNTYVALLFQTFTLNTLDAIVSDIESSPQTEERLYELVIDALQAKPPRLRFWASSVVSWILWSVRPLRVEELGAIVAVNLEYSSVTQFRPMVSMDMERDLRSHLGLVLKIENRYARITSALARGILSRDGIRGFPGLQNHSDLTRLCLHYITLILKDEKPETWQKCLSQVSREQQVPDSRDPALVFLDYACRFWPTHLLLVKELDSSLKDMVLEFLLDPKVGKKWFQLYLLCISQSADKLIGDPEAPGPAIAVSEPELLVPGKAISVGLEPNINPPGKATNARRLAVHMASYVGLGSIIPDILGKTVPAKNLKMIHVRRGYSERAVAVLDTGSRYYLDCAICNDNDNVVKEVLDSDPARTTSYFPLHRAARAGCLKTAQKIFNLLEDPVQIDQEGRTPLHLAAIGGSTKMIRFLLGKEDPDTHPRRMDVPSMIDTKDGNSQTPLILASRMGNIHATKLLIESGADLTIRDGAGKTALHYAVLYCPEAVGIFATADLAYILEDEYTPLHTAASSGSVQTTSILVSALRASSCPVAAINGRDDQNKTPLHYAAENGNTEVVEILLRFIDSSEIEDVDYQQAAELAAIRGHLAIVKLLISAAKEISRQQLLEAGSRAGQLLIVEYLLYQELASPDGDQASDWRPISLAASKGYNQVVRTLLRYKAAVNIEDATRQTPLHHAAENGRYQVAQTLLHHQANVNALDIERNTPLHSAAKAEKVDVVELLLEHGADVEACSRNEETALHLAVKSPKTVQALLNANAERRAIDMLGQTPLHKATYRKCYESADLLRWDADMDAKDDDGRPPLYYAISQNDLIMVKALCKDRPSLRDSQDLMHLALEWAVESSALDVLQFLLNISAESVNKLNSNGRSIIHEAAQRKSPEILTLLLKSGADVNLADSSKRAPLHDAASVGLEQNMQKLIKSGAEIDKADENKQTPLHMAALSTRVEGVDVLLKAEAAIDVRDHDGWTPLNLAAFYGYVQVVERLLKGKADVRLVSNEGWSPLHGAADSLEITRMLVAHGADVNLQKEDLWTPLHLATYWSKPAVAKLLVENRANPNQVTSAGTTALHLAIIGNIASLVQLMLDKGADLKVKTRDGLSCVSLAVDNDSDEVLKVLLGVGSPSASGTVWDSEDMAAAYWKAIEQHSAKFLDTLVKKEGQLLEKVSTDGFTGLETCLRNRQKGCEEEPIAIRFLELGVDPFKRLRADHESAFELGIISRRRAKLDFMDACLERVPEDFSSAASGLGFKELRIATELDKPDLWKKLEPLRDAASAVTDHDGWGLDHFIHQSADRIDAQSRVGVPLKPTRTPRRIVALPVWLPPNMDTEDLLKIAPSGLHFASDGGRYVSSPLCLRADFPFPPRDQGLIYFEITILHAEHSAESDIASPIVTLGFCGEFCDQTEAHPGWNMWSVGYHGDDGYIFEEGSYGENDTGCMFGPGNTVGCGIDYASGEYFFTVDGKIIARRLSRKIISRKLYPIIGHHAGACNVNVNFGQDAFVWPGAKEENGSDMRQPKLQRRTSIWSNKRSYIYS